MLEYKGYRAYLKRENGIFSGDVYGISDVITFEGDSLEEAEQAFHDSVDDYLQMCKERGEKPEGPI